MSISSKAVLGSKLYDVNKYYFLDRRFIPSRPQVLKIGAFDNIIANKLGRAFPNGKVVQYEADPINFYNILKKKHEPNVTNKHGVVSSFEGIQRFNHYNIRGSHSTFDRSDRKKICTFVLGTIDILNIISYYDILLLNCEGSEITILDAIVYGWDDFKLQQIAVGFHHFVDPKPTISRLYKYFDGKRVREKYNYWLFTRKVLDK